MKIYQIHEYGGQWEDSYDYIVGSYLSKNKAIIEKERFEEIATKCDSCPLNHCAAECIINCIECRKRRVDEAREYCNEYEPYDETYECKNFFCLDDDSYFKIEEVDVIE